MLTKVNFQIISCGWMIQSGMVYQNKLYTKTAIEYVNRWPGIISNHYVIEDGNGDKRNGSLKNIVTLLNNNTFNDDDIILLVDLDDYITEKALFIIYRAYKLNPKLLLTYGSYRTLSGHPIGVKGIYIDENFRTSGWKATHLKTFKYKLFKHLKEENFKDKNGNYFMSSGDLALMIPMLEMAGLNRIMHIPEIIYIYNDINPLNDHKIPGNSQHANEMYIRSMPKYDRVEF